jgi:hypothetical protein
MYRIDNSTASPSMPTPDVPGPNVDGFFTNGDPTLGQLATIVDDDWLNAIQEELCYCIEQSGQTLDKTDRTQLYQAIGTLLQNVPYGESSTVANTYTVSLAPVPSSYETGKVFLVKFAHGNTGAATLNVNALGAKNIKRLDGNPLEAADIQDGMLAIFSYDGTNIQLLNANEQKRLPYGESTSSPNTYTVTLNPIVLGYITGMTFLVKFSNANTGAATLNVNALGAKDIKKVDGSALTAGEITNGMIGQFSYDGTNLQLLNPVIISGAIKNVVRAGNMAMNPWQRGTSFAACADGAYTADRFQWTQVGSGVVTVSKETTTVAGLIAGNVLSTAALKVAVTTADASIGATDWYAVRYPMEGYDFQQIAQKQFVISFLVYATVTGTYTVGLSNSNGDRSYPATFTVDASNTWERKTIVIPASPSAGTWLYTTGLGLDVRFVLAAGSNFISTPDTWNTGVNTNKIAATGQVNNMATIGNVFMVDQFKIEEGQTATPYPFETIEETMRHCQRYYYEIRAVYGIFETSPFNEFQGCVRFPVQMRTTPTTYAPTVCTFITNNGGAVEVQSSPNLTVENVDSYGGRFAWRNLSSISLGNPATLAASGGFVTAEFT